VSDRRSQIVAEVLLVAVAAVWGWTFVMVKDAVTLYPTLQFLALRFSLAACVMGLVVAGGRLRRRAHPAAREAAADMGSFPLVLEGPSVPVQVAGGRRALPRGPSSVSARPSGSFRGALGGGALMGLALGAGYVFQTLGLERTTASNAGFITGLMVVLVPLLQGLMWRAWIGGGALAGALLAAAGLYLLSGGAGGLRLVGDGLVFLCAVSFAAHILLTSTYAAGRDASVLTFLQLASVAVMTAVLAVTGAMSGLSPALALPREPSVLVALVVTGVFASAAAFYVQTFAQKHAPPTRTAIILTMEPVFAGVFGYLLADERLGVTGWIGAGLIVAGMLVSEFVSRRSLGPQSAPGGAMRRPRSRP
jgi:drug/metabolite transporter (DMT)-like permease